MRTRSSDAVSDGSGGLPGAGHGPLLPDLLQVIILWIEAIFVGLFYGTYELLDGVCIHPDGTISTPFIDLRNDGDRRDLAGAHTDPAGDLGSTKLLFDYYGNAVIEGLGKACWGRHEHEAQQKGNEKFS